MLHSVHRPWMVHTGTEWLLRLSQPQKLPLKNKHWSHCPTVSKSNGRLHMSMVISAQDMTVRSNWTCSIITQWSKWRGTDRVMIARRKTEVAFKQNNQPITSLITHPAFSVTLGLLNSRTCSYKVVCNITARILTWQWVAMAVNYCYNCRQWRHIIQFTFRRVSVLTKTNAPLLDKPLNMISILWVCVQNVLGSAQVDEKCG
jgi:hypothetical protein